MFWIIIILVMLFVLSYLPYVELVVLPAVLGISVWLNFNNGEAAWWGFFISLIVLFGVYFSRAGIIISVIFSLFWGWVVGMIVYKDIGWSMLSAMAFGIIAFFISLAIHESKRGGIKKAEETQ